MAALWHLPLPVERERLSGDNRLPGEMVSLRSEPEEVPPPIPFRLALWFRRGRRLRALAVTLSYDFLAVHLDLVSTVVLAVSIGGAD